MLFQTPRLLPQEAEVIGEIDAIHRQFAAPLPRLREWPGLPWRETHDRVVGASDEETPAAASYRLALGFVLQLADAPDFSYDEGIFRALHFLMMRHDPANNPGRWRRGAMLVARQEHFAGYVDYRAPDFRRVPALMAELVAELNTPGDTPAYVRAAMAHLNLATIHPFLDGSGRVARALHTLVLAREGIWMPAFASIDEYVSVNHAAYVNALQEAHGGAWQPEREARSWVRFCLTAHLRQARTLAQSSREYDRLWEELEHEVTQRGLPERVVGALAAAAIAGSLTSQEYETAADVSAAAAGGDLQRLVEAGLLAPEADAFMPAVALKLIAERTREARAPECDPFAARL
jgi:Fic family protein